MVKTLKTKKKPLKHEQCESEHASTSSTSINCPTVKIDREKIKSISEECKKAGLNSKQISLVIKKFKRSEFRRLKRNVHRKTDKICYHCRKSGHTVAECTDNFDDSEVTGTLTSGICFKCGLTDHAIGQCKVKVEGFPFAKCFVCKQTGHLSRDCKANEHGMYPNGGCCRHCEKTNHLAKDCPGLNKGNAPKILKLSKIESGKGLTNVDFEETEYASDLQEVKITVEDAPTKTKTKRKIVRM